ncbi:NAD(P)/FAD-dependent oxidoreductase [Leptospira selangorensis]|uniref:NAD(P)/FAD-dependent oxidoreductase n=1 Tax=Leptospira selangorensis TaxID=2484982 RepID=A0A5F2BX56_9LEPT|nr:NAD(P)/FAD-dependent oxidoreductase [Leptospira selangorensis]TGM12300.1 NAD(P)/FAD-dependent oxidoreductase [Leptospira selangorensis]TGM14657.1 NAD(P)/FAD-dependent oxidoreductase [Leptospira selangorensis]
MDFSSEEYDICIIGSGPNGLAAASVLAGSGLSVLILEASDTIGGGLRTKELTLPGFHHDVCSAAHPMGILSPYLKTLPLEKHGLKWIEPEASVAHPLDGESAVLLKLSLEETAENLGVDKKSYIKLISPFLKNPEGLLSDALAPLGIPKHPFLLARFGLLGLQPAKSLANFWFKEERAKALFAGCAGHAIFPLEKFLSGALGLLFSLTGHVRSWPVVEGGSAMIAKSLESYLKGLGVKIQTNYKVSNLAQLPKTKAILFDTSPDQLGSVAGNTLSSSYISRISSYKYGPGVFKMDWALDGPIPWKDPNCLKASTVHVGGKLSEIAKAESEVWSGKHPDRPYMLVVQQSQFDPTRAPKGKHTGYAYCHVPSGSTKDMTEILENQIERFAPGFKDRILARHSMNTKDFYSYNLNYVGGAITGGAADLPQAFFRPIARMNPYTTPNPHIYICSASTPPGGGVHGMCGYYAAKTVLKKIHKLKSIRY